ncbi:MAG: pilus assembly protein PilM [Tumebacillaceae bacterium]
MLGLISEVTIGIEIGVERLLLAEIKKKGGRYTLQRVAQAAIPSEVIVDGRIIQADTLGELIRETMRAANMSSKNVHLVVPSQFVVIRQLQLPDVPVKQLRKVIDFELQNSIHLPFEDTLFDFVKLDKTSAAADLNGIGMAAVHEAAAAADGSLCDVMLIASTRAAIDPMLQAARGARLKPQSVDIGALALARAYQKLGHAMADDTTMFVDVSEASTDIHIFHGEMLKFTRNVPMALDSYKMDRELSKPLHVLQILEYFQSNTDYRSFANDLAYEIERSMNFFRYTLNNRDAALTNLVLTGLLPKSGILSHYLIERFPGIAIGKMPFDDILLAPEAAAVEDSLSEYAVPIGLALKEV